MAGFRTHLWFFKAVLATALPVFLCCTAPMSAEEELCMEGTLLFREDFGGNDPNDPRIQVPPEGEKSTVPGMSDLYQQLTTDAYPSMGSGRYLVTKSGYCNGDTTGWTLPGADLSGQRSQWYIQDDHTYPDDYSRGYFLEIDGSGGSQQFYETEISGLCAGSELTFSAYVANVFAWFQYDWHTKYRGPVVAPGLKFVLTDPTNGTVLAAEEMPSIPFDESLPAKTDWQYSSTWHLVGMNFTVPTGVEAVRLSIYNNVNNGNGNDFAIDDIEVRLCLSASIEGEHMVCAGQEVTLQAESPDLRFMTAPAYKWWHSTDSLAWTESSATSASLTIPNTKTNDEGWYRVAIAGNENIDKENCRAMSEPFRLRVKDVCEEKEELCMEGTLLFREDFGGNDPNDPIVGTDKVPGMDYSNYTQRLNADHVTGQPGLFWLIKSGYYHADTTNGRDPMKNHSNWYLQDDHTYPDDKSRGYLLEIDGKGGKAPFYSTVISDLCPASRLTFSAYVANVNKASNYIDGQHARIYPRLRFELTDAETGDFLADHSTGDIPYDPDLTVNTDFWYSSKWYLHGMNFEVPAGVSSIRLTIYNDVENNGAGNDFALDDIEIRLCAPPVTIEGPDGVCKGNSAELTAHFENDGTFAEPLEYTWLYSSTGKPNGTWTNIGTWDNENGLGMWMNIVNEKNAGWYKFMVAGSGNSANGHCRVVSEPYLLRLKNCSSHNQNLCMDGTLLFREDFGGNDPDDPSVSTATVPGMDSRYSNTGVNGGMGSWKYTIRKEGYTNGIQWHLQDDHTCPDDKNRGYFLEIDGGGGDIPFYSRTIDGLCAGSVLTFSAYVINVHYAGQIQWFYENKRGYVYPRLKFVLIDPSTGTTLANESTGDILPDYSKIWDISLKESAEWQLVGTTFQVPVGVESIQMYIYNDVSTNGNGNDFALDDIEIRVCLNAAIEGQHEVCENEPVKLTASSPDFSPLTNPAYKWYFSADSLTWTELPEKTGTLTYAKCQKTAHEGWYRAAVADSENIDKENCRAMSEPFRLRVKDDCEPPKEELCIDGTLLFREDFGGNDPNDPRLVSTPVDIPGMTYEQLLTDRFGTMKSGGFLITKEGYCNGDTSVTNPARGSQWHLQDDHTYPGDKTRGYFLEIDGRGDHADFYKRTIDNLCAGTKLTFSAYVANVMTWGMYVGSPGKYTYPRLEFVLYDPDGNELKSYDTGDIPYDPGADSAYVKNWDLSAWKNSAEWHLVGMNFTVPEGVSSVTLTIYNNVEGWIGNDFALDDIEIRLCVPPVTIEGPNEVCLDAKPTLTAHFDNDGTFSNPDYQWYFSTDSAGFYNEIDPAMALTYTIENAQKADEGWYRIGISERGQMTYMNCRAISEPFHLTVKECEPPEPDPDLGLCNNGILLFREDFGGNDPSDPDVNCDLTEGVRYRNACQTPDNIEEGHYLITKRGKGYYENQWLERDDHTYPNDFSRGYYLVVNASNNRLFYSIELPGGESGSEFSFSAYVITLNESIFGDEEGTYYRYPSILFDFVNGSTFERIAAYPVADIKLEPSVSHSKRWHLVGTKFTLPKDIPYIVLNAYTSMIGRMGNDFGLDDIEFRLCRTPIEQHADTTVCDTLLPLDWRGRLWENEGTLIDTLRYTDGEDSVYIHISLHTKNCCQEAQLVKADTTLCGYALPFVWHDAVFDRPSTQTVIEKNERGCDTFVYTLTVDTVHCVKRYPIIVNKYNWVLLVDNIAVRRLFPDKTPVAYQWYKDDEPIAGATEDDYSEQNELHGVFCMLLHFADGSSVWSNIIDLSQTPTAAPVRVKAYNSSGILVREWQATEEQGGLSLPPGIYLLRYEGGDEVFTEKRIVP